MSPEVAPADPLRDSGDVCRADAVFPSHVGALASSRSFGSNGAYLSLGQARVAVYASPTALRWRCESTSLHSIVHILGSGSEAQVLDIDAPMPAGTTIARVQHVKGSRITVSQHPDGSRSCHVLAAKVRRESDLLSARGEDDAFSGRRSRGCHQFGGAPGTRVAASLRAPIGIRASAKSRPLATYFAPGGSAFTPGATRLFVRENDAAGCTLGHVAPLTQVRPRPGVVSATAGAFSYQSIRGIDPPLNHDGGVN
jgi:hypothetical protein